MKQFVVSLALTTALFATPTLAQTTSGSSTGSGGVPSGSDASSMMTCEEFSAMDSSGQEQALQTMQASMESDTNPTSPGSSGSATSGSTGASGTASPSSGTNDTASSGSSGSTSPDSGGAMKSGATDSSDSMASGDDMSMMATKVVTYCETNPSAMVSDAMAESAPM